CGRKGGCARARALCRTEGDQHKRLRARGRHVSQPGSRTRPSVDIAPRADARGHGAARPGGRAPLPRRGPREVNVSVSARRTRYERNSIVSALPRKRTKSRRLDLSALCQKQTYAVQQFAALFDHLVGAAPLTAIA